MSNYTKITDFEAKDSLSSGDSGKVIKGAEFETEFDNISTAIATKADIAGPTFNLYLKSKDVNCKSLLSLFKYLNFVIKPLFDHLIQYSWSMNSWPLFLTELTEIRYSRPSTAPNNALSLNADSSPL